MRAIVRAPSVITAHTFIPLGYDVTMGVAGTGRRDLRHIAIVLALGIGVPAGIVLQTLLESGGDPYWLRVSLDLRKSSYARGEPIPVDVVLYNPGDRRVRLWFPSMCLTSLSVFDQNGTPVYWEWDLGCAQSTVEFDIEPGGQKVLSTTWDQRDKSGTPVTPGGFLLHIIVRSNPSYSAAAYASVG